MRRPTTYSFSTSVSQSGTLTAVTRGRQLEKRRVSGKFLTYSTHSSGRSSLRSARPLYDEVDVSCRKGESLKHDDALGFQAVDLGEIVVGAAVRASVLLA
jgi:hypothetical protein